MPISAIEGKIARRVVVNLRVAPDVLAPLIPAPFQLKIVDGWAIAGVCLTRLQQMRPVGLPAFIGLDNENSAHRVVVTWTDESGETHDGVYLPIRHTDSKVTIVVGQKLFPAELTYAKIQSAETDAGVDVRLRTDDGFNVHFKGTFVENMPVGSVFKSAGDLSDFQYQAKIGFWPRKEGGYDAHRLEVDKWQGRSMSVDFFESSFFSDATMFPAGSVAPDSAFAMYDIQHRWRQAKIELPRLAMSAIK
jgi:hypothetical protein